MSPAKSCSDLNGPRPSPLLIHKDSRLIRKPSQPPPPPQLRQPVIIYTHSPKVIHTQPKDFMALVQRLTGFTPPNADQQPVKKPNLNDNDSSSVLTDDGNNNNNNTDDDDRRSSFLSADVPLFTPRSSVLRYSFDTPPFSSPGLVNSLSPNFMEFLKGLPEF